jgi:hypothetical protein
MATTPGSRTVHDVMPIAISVRALTYFAAAAVASRLAGALFVGLA